MKKSRQVWKDVEARITEILAKNSAEIASVQVKLDEASKDLSKASEDQTAAASVLDFGAYEAASAQRARAQERVNVCNDRLSRLRGRRFMSQEDSDAVIVQLLESEEAMERDFVEAVESHYDALRQIYEAYMSEVAQTERVIARWISQIHGNYRRYDNSTSYTTMGKECYVRQFQYRGGGEAVALRDALDRHDRRRIVTG